MQIENVEAAAGVLRDARRVLVIGCSGGGKTTLSLALADRLRLPYVSMDREFFWLPGWVTRGRTEQRQLIASVVKQESWIMDGTNASSFDLRLPRTDVVLWVRIPRLQCIWGVAARWLMWLGRTRPEMTPGCPERLDLDFLRYIWNFERDHAPVIAALAAYEPAMPLLELKSRRQVRELLDSLGRQA
ncbi:P-loop NTPase family protein [Rhizobium halophilum]|uniref:AAA family ATPase n=1 Tax=Rhizobium halophilum TaxID=2846852 RepID=UPI001EFCB112|nr:AAA family ATPase [Rhizobium halophilum]MCF6370771.1 AAA family ATPase [Rhizobium halophilum]